MRSRTATIISRDGLEEGGVFYGQREREREEGNFNFNYVWRHLNTSNITISVSLRGFHCLTLSYTTVH